MKIDEAYCLANFHTTILTGAVVAGAYEQHMFHVSLSIDVSAFIGYLLRVYLTSK